MTDFRAVYDNFVLIYPAVAKVPPEPAIAFARILEHSTPHGVELDNSWWIDRNYREVEIDRAILMAAYWRICRLSCFDPDPRAAQLAMVMHASSRKYEGQEHQCFIPCVGNTEQYVEAFCLLHSAIGRDLVTIVCAYTWRSDMIAPRGPIIAFDRIPKHILFGMGYPADHFKYAYDYIRALRTAHPSIDLSAEQVDDFILMCTKADGAFLPLEGRIDAMGTPKEHVDRVNKMRTLLDIAGL